MNETTFEQALKTGMAPVTERPSLDAKIEARLNRAKSTAKTWSATLGAAAAVVVMSFLLFPRATAQPTFAQVAGALDDVKSVRMDRYVVMEDGERVFSGRIDYQEGKWRMEMPGGTGEYLWFKGNYYFYDKGAGRYVHSLRPDGPFGVSRRGMRLSVMLEPGGGYDDKEVTMTEGRFKGADVIIATVEDKNFGQRTVIRASLGTLLPIDSESFSLEGGVWRLRSVTAYDYAPKFAPGHFDLRPGVLVVDYDDAQRNLRAEMTRDELATIKIKEGRLVVRSVDVARDGTVFVTYQVGDKTRSGRGYRLTVTDDLGTTYAPSKSLTSFDERLMEQSPDGRIEREVLVPFSPDETWRPRTVTLFMRFTDEREPVVFTTGVRYDADRNGRAQALPNTTGVDYEDLPPLEQIWSGAFEDPSCEWLPELFAKIEFSEFSQDIKAQIFRAQIIAQFYYLDEDWLQAEKWMQEKLRLMRKHEEQGLGPFSLNSTLKELEAVRKRLGRGLPAGGD